VDQGGGLQRLAGPLLRQLLGGQLPQLVVDQRQELAGGVGVALLDGGEDAGDFTHGRHRAGRGGTMCWSILDGAARRQHALDDDRVRHVEPLFRLALREGHRPQHTGRTSGLDLHAAVHLVNRAAGHEEEASVGQVADGVQQRGRSALASIAQPQPC